jgi:hypothetical protein
MRASATGNDAGRDPGDFFRYSLTTSEAGQWVEVPHKLECHRRRRGKSLPVVRSECGTFSMKPSPGWSTTLPEVADDPTLKWKVRYVVRLFPNPNEPDENYRDGLIDTYQASQLGRFNMYRVTYGQNWMWMSLADYWVMENEKTAEEVKRREDLLAEATDARVRQLQQELDTLRGIAFEAMETLKAIARTT